jgi:hypothetical protein
LAKSLKVKKDPIDELEYIEAVTTVGAHDVYAFTGSIEFEIDVSIGSVKAHRKVRLDYSHTPDREYFDPKLKRTLKGWGSSQISYSVFEQNDGWVDLPSALFIQYQGLNNDEMGELDEYVTELYEADANRIEKAAQQAHEQEQASLLATQNRLN